MSDPWSDIRERISPNGKYQGEHPDDCEIDLSRILSDANALLTFLRAWETADTDEELQTVYAALPRNLRK